MSVISLIKQSDESFSMVTNQTIESMRNAALLEVGQNLQESSKRSLLRATMENAKFTRKELEVLYQWFEEGHRQAIFWGGGARFQRSGMSHTKQEPTIDLERFTMIFRYLSPWGFGEHAATIAMRAFKLVDTTATGQMNFHSFCQILGIMSRSTLQERLKLLYILHLDDLSNCEEEEEEGKKKERGNVIDYSKLQAGQENDLVLDASRGQQSGDEDDVDSDGDALYSPANLSSLTLEETRRLYAAGLLKPLSPLDPTFIPRSIGQSEYIQLCKTLYSLLQDSEDEAELFKGMGRVANNLLSIGEENVNETHSETPLSQAESSRTLTSPAVMESGGSPALAGGSEGQRTDCDSEREEDGGERGKNTSGSEEARDSSLPKEEGDRGSLEHPQDGRGEKQATEEESTEMAGVKTSEEGKSHSKVTPPDGEATPPDIAASSIEDSFEKAMATAAEMEERWFLTFEQFASALQREPFICQFFAEQNSIDLSGSNVDPVLNPYTRTIMATSP